MKRRFYLLLLFFLGTLSVTAYRLIFLTNRNIVERKDETARLQQLPPFSALTVSGNQITSRALSQRVVYVQFLDGRNDDEFQLLRTVRDNWGPKGLSLILVVSHIDNFIKRKDTSILQDIYTLDWEKNRDIERAFMVTRGEYRYFVFNKEGLLRNSAYSSRGYEEGPKAELRNLITGEYFDLEGIFPRGKPVSEIPWLSMLDEIRRSQKCKRYFFSLFRSLCSGCYGGVLLNMLDRSFLASDEQKYVAAILDRRYDGKDLRRIRDQLQVQLPIFIADSRLNDKWEALVADFRESDLNNITIVLDAGGNILRVVDQKCNCLSELQRLLLKEDNF